MDDTTALRLRIRRCLHDERIVQYVEHELVDEDEIVAKVESTNVYERSKRTDSYINYANAAHQLSEINNRIDSVTSLGVVNRKSISFIAGILVFLLLAAIQLLFRSPGQALLVTASGGTALYSIYRWRSAFKTRLSLRPILYSFATTSLCLFIAVGLPLYFHVRIWTVYSSLIVALALATGFLGADRIVRQQGVAVVSIINYYWDRFDKSIELDRLREAWLEEAQEKVVMAYVTLAVNQTLGEDQDKLLVEQSSEGLQKLHDLDLIVPTSSESRVLNTIKGIDSGSIAISGPRGAGKSTLLRLICEGETIDYSRPIFPVYTTAPAQYVPRDFLVELFQVVCENYIEANGYNVRPIHHFTLRKPAGRFLRDITYTSIRLVCAVALLVVLAWSIYTETQKRIPSLGSIYRDFSGNLIDDLTNFWSGHRRIGQLLLFLGAFILWPPKSKRRHLRWHREPANVGAARRYLLQLQAERTNTWGVSGNLPGISGTAVAVTRGGSLKYFPWTYPELVSNFRDFVALIAEEIRDIDGSVVICIDEIDRIGSVEQADRFISEIKAIFGIENCFYIVSIAEDVGSAFARRTVSNRSVFENAFDNVVQIKPLSLAEASELILQRVPGFTDPFAFLSFSLSGGIPRELIRVTRRLVEINTRERDSDRQYPRLEDLATALVKDEMAEVVGGIRTHLSSVQSFRGDLGPIFDQMRRLLREIELTNPCQVGNFTDLLTNLATFDLGAYFPPRHEPDAESAQMESEDVVRSILMQLRTLTLFHLTVMEVFQDEIFNASLARGHSSLNSYHSFEELAAARRELILSPTSCAITLARFRDAWHLAPL